MSICPLISIIVPVYNAENTLNRCVDSILQQTVTDWELLLINDGSTDKSGEICDNYAQKNSRIRVFHKENGGVSSARNLGLDYVRGEWITFVDADDELKEDYLAKLIFSVQGGNVDLVIAGYDMIDSSKKICKSTSNLSNVPKFIDVNSAIRLVYRFEYYPCFVWSKLYKCSIIKLNKLSFNNTIYYSEDRLFIVKYLCACRNLIYYTTQSVYKYYIRNNSAMTSLVSNFNYKSVTGFYATLLMFSALKNKGVTKDVIFYAWEDIIDSYDYTLERMEKFSIKDRKLRNNLRKRMFEEISYIQYLYVRGRKLISRLKYRIVYKWIFSSNGKSKK